MILLRFQRGEVVLEDDSSGSKRQFKASEYQRLIHELIASENEFKDEALQPVTVPRLSSALVLRDYQSEALKLWEEAGFRGIVVLPTGAGKTVLAVKGIERLKVATLIVVPTLVLLEQWRKTLEESFGIDVGLLGGGFRNIKPITVSTYDSAALQSHNIGDRFSLVIFDEVHHLPSPSNSRIAIEYLAPYRLGLTATLSKDPDALDSLSELVGQIVYQRKAEDLAGVHLSDYTVKTIQLPLTSQEKLEYDGLYAVYKGFLQRRGIRMRTSKDYLAFVRRSGRDPEARRALMARNEAMNIALNSRSKEDCLRNLLLEHPNEKTLIFTRHNRLVYRISRGLLIPAITHQTVKEEREEILDRFRRGIYRRIVTSQVLDEGIDVPDASMAVILSGTGSNREFVQRLGRILRKREGKQATLYELVSMGTAETRLSLRRKLS